MGKSKTNLKTQLEDALRKNGILKSEPVERSDLSSPDESIRDGAPTHGDHDADDVIPSEQRLRKNSDAQQQDAIPSEQRLRKNSNAQQQDATEESIPRLLADDRESTMSSRHSQTPSPERDTEMSNGVQNMPGDVPKVPSGTPSKSQGSQNLTKMELSASGSQTPQDLENSRMRATSDGDNNATPATPKKGSHVLDKAPAATGNETQEAPTNSQQNSIIYNTKASDGYNIAGVNVNSLSDKLAEKIGKLHGNVPNTIAPRRLAHLDEYQHSSPVPLALFLMIFFIVGMVVLRFTRSSAEPKKRCRKAPANDATLRNSPELSC